MRADDVGQLCSKTSDIPFSTATQRVFGIRKDRMLEQGLGERLNDIINSYVGSRGKITARAGMEEHRLSIEDNSLNRDIKRQQDSLASMLVYLRDKENYYYSMFAKIETAMNSSGNQMAYLTMMYGG